MGPIANRIDAKIRAQLDPQRLDIIDQSESHRGHAGHNPHGESHFRLVIVSAAFSGQSRLARQRLVYTVLAEELAGPIHALSLVTLTPEEDAPDVG